MFNGVSSITGTSETVIFTKLKEGFNIIPVVMDRPFVIDCSVNNKNVKISLYRKQSNDKKEIVRVDGKIVKRKGDEFQLVVRSYFESTRFYCHGELYGTAYEKEVTVIIIATSNFNLTVTPLFFIHCFFINFNVYTIKLILNDHFS